MANKSLLNRIDVKSPCNESWDEMVGNNEVRFCSHCAKDVHDLSAMKRADAEKLVQKSSGKLCVRYVKSSTGKLITTQPKFTQIKRRATIAASVLATSLTFTTLAYAQGEPIKPKEDFTQTNKYKFEDKEIKQGFATIAGEVQDQNGAVIPNIKITLRDAKTEKISEAISNNDGFYQFKNVEPSLYNIKIEAEYFEKFVLKDVEVFKDSKVEKTLTLIGKSIIGVVATIDEPLTTTETKPTETIPEKPIENLPLNRRQFKTMGLFVGVSSQEKRVKPKKKKN
jgi:Carboxypeptidase regulatory-like domain